jgi:peroxiredoxin
MRARLLPLLMLFLAIAVNPAWSAELASAPDAITPILLGARVPEASLADLDGKPTSLAAAIDGKPAVVVFYRGGWCPYCNLQLSGLRKITGDLKQLGYRLLAISPDRPEELRKTVDRDKLDYQVLSDSAGNAMRAFGIGYRVDAETIRKYQGYGIDLSAASGNAEPFLPVPAVYVVDAAGTLQFSFVHPDYRVRVPEDVVLAAARAIAQKRHALHPSR